MEKAAEYWRAVEWTFSFRGVAYYWLQRLGDQKTRLIRHMRPTGELSAGMPCIKPFGCSCDHEVQFWGDTIFAVPMDEDARCEPFEIEREYIVIHEMKTDALLREAFELLGVQPGELRETAFPRAFHVGCWQPQGGALLPIYLTIPSTVAQFSGAAMGLLATVETPFIFLALSMKHLDQVAVAALARHKCPFLTMDKFVAPDDEGNLLLVKRFPEAEAGAESEEKGRPNIFRRRGEYWDIVYDGLPAHMRHSKGIATIVCLLRVQDRELHAAQILVDVAGEENIPLLGSAGEVLSPDAIAEYRETLLDLRERIHDAEQHNDISTKSALEEQLNVLTQHLGSALGLHKRVRKASDDAERIRKAVWGNIKRALDKLEKAHPPLWQHLSRSLTTGMFMSYSPSSPVDWQF